MREDASVDTLQLS